MASEISSWTYDVFLSFRGEDTRNSFTSHLYEALVQAGINTFRDSEELNEGMEISQELCEAIYESRFFLVVFSKNYGSSTWCLDELDRIMGCMEHHKGQMVWPVFYDVDPSEVRKQKGFFGEAFTLHEEIFKEGLDKVERWRKALTKAANLSGWHLDKREIVRRESPNPGERSRLWYHEDVVQVLNKNEGTKKVQGIFLDMHDVKVFLHAEAFSEMKKLRLLIIRNAKVIGSPPSYLSDELKWLQCHHSSSSIVPSTFHPTKLVVLDISHYPIWQLTKLKGFENLRRLILVDCEMLTEIGDISSMPKLVELKIIVCLNLECFSNGGLKGKSLVNLCFMACPKLKKFPDILEEMGSLEWLNLEGCGVTELPTSIEKLTALKSLNLNMCEDMVHHPSSIIMLKRLEYISLDNCKRLEKFPQFWNSIAVSSCSEGNHIDINHHSTFGISLNTLSLNNSGLLDLDFLAAYNCFDSLKFLYLSNTKIRRFPRGMSKLKSLQVINLNHCKLLEGISNLPPNIVILDASGCNLLAKHDHLLNIFHIGYLCQDWKQVFLHQAIYNNKSSAPFVLPGSVIPNFIAHCSRGCPVTLEVPLHMEQNIKGIILCGVFDPKNDSYHYIEVEINGRPWKPINIYFNLLHSAEGFWPYKSDHLWVAYCNLMVSNLKKLLKNNPGHLEVAVFKVTHRPKQRSLLTNCAARLVFDVQNEEQPYFW